jgi:predicted dehydrogenase
MNKKACLLAGALCAAFLLHADTKIGIIGLDTSHALAFTELINVKKDPAMAGYTVVAAYQWGSRDIVSATNRYPTYIPKIKAMGVEIVSSIPELLAKSDVVLLETNDGREHFEQAKAVFASGKRVFIDKPLAHNLTDALKIYKAGKACGAQYFSSSALRFSDVAIAARKGEYGRIKGAALIAPSPEEEQGTHNYYTWYGIHGFEPLVAIMGTGIEKVSCFRNADTDVINAVWKDGRMGELRLQRKSWIYTGYVLPEKKPKGWKDPVILYDGYKGYQPLVKEIIAFFRTGKAPVSPEETLEIFAFMEAAEMSAKRGGAPVTLAEAIAACGGL